MSASNLVPEPRTGSGGRSAATLVRREQHEVGGREKNQNMNRVEFSIVTKRIEWLKAAGTDNAKTALLKCLADNKVPARMPRSRCRVCKTALVWGGGTYNFDHRDNNSANATQRNCFLVCRNCHGKATKTRVVREYEPFLGSVVGYKTQKLKVGYKKATRKPAKRTTVRKPTSRTAGKPAAKTVRKPAGKATRAKR